ncbi:hypothetical protein [Nonomuraea sp. NPDC049309]
MQRPHALLRLRAAQATAALPGCLRALDAAGIKVITAETTRPPSTTCS